MFQGKENIRFYMGKLVSVEWQMLSKIHFIYNSQIKNYEKD